MIRPAFAASILALFAAANAQAESAEFRLKSADGKMLAPLAAADQKATVLLFLMHDCPVTNLSAPEMARLSAEFATKGVRFYGVYATETAAEITKHRSEYSLPFPGLLDPDLKLAHVSGATRAPEAAVFSAEGKLLYRGRIDDRAVKPGVTRPVPTSRDLHRALEAILAGKQPSPQFTQAVGCYLPTK